VFYRVSTFILLAVALVVTGLYLHDMLRAPHRGEPDDNAREAIAAPRVVDVADQVARINQDLSTKSDVSHTFYSSETASVHLHALGLRQMCPLHIHQTSKEATVIVSGRPEVETVFERNGVPTREKHAYGAGTLIYSSPFCGHAWVNRSSKEMQANLVFTAPPFGGNFYVEESDPRLKQAEAPVVVDPDEALRSFLGRAKPSETVDLGIMDGMLSLLLVKDAVHLDADASERLLYVVRGSGVLEAGRELAVREELLLLIPSNLALDLKANAGTPLAVFAFRPVKPSR
jgi:hypothetical protein